MDPIEGAKNSVTTDCGHAFHATCLMTSVAHNGFGCPYCRTAMAQVPEEEDDDDSEGEYDDDEIVDDDALRGFRFFMNNLTGEAHEEEDIAEEDVYIEYQNNTEPEEPEEPEVPVPTASFIAQKLTQQGITMEDLVKTLLLHHDEYESQNEQLERVDSEMFGRLRVIISNFTPEQNV
jgi:hypothetical protein